MSFYSELKRRNVFRVALLYVVAAWLILQVADVLFPNLGVPDWAFGLVFGLLLLFFIPVLIFAWAFEITPEGLKRERDIAVSDAGDGHTGSRINTLIVVLLLLAIGGLILDRMIPESGSPAEVSALGPAGTSNPNADGTISADTIAAAKFMAREDSLANDVPSIAVLPFVTRSDDHQDEYFAAGIHDDLLTQLAKIDGLKVISRTSVMQYANTTRPMQEIAAELGVSTVLEGGVQRAGDRIRVNAQLIEALSDQHLWAETYDETLSVSNIFAIQSQLAQAIAAALETTLSPSVQARIDNQPTENLLAWDLALRGRYLLDKEQSQSNLEGAVDFYRGALQADPDYARAWAGLAQAIGELVAWSYWPDDELSEAWDAAERAIELDPNLAEGYFSRGDLMRITRQFDQGEADFLKGLMLSPGSADGHSRYGDLLRDSGQVKESVLESRRAIELDPRMVRIRVSLLQNLYFNRDWDGVLEQANQVLQLEPDTAEAWYWIGLASCWTRDFPTAIDAVNRAFELDPDTPYLRAGRAYPDALSGNHAPAREMLSGAEADGWPLPEIGLLYGWVGDMDAAYDYMYRALQERPSALHYLATDPTADAMRKDPRWAELMQALASE